MWTKPIELSRPEQAKREIDTASGLTSDEIDLIVAEELLLPDGAA